ncbi:redoxin domain-containing protein [Granulicella sp. 5B5]|uniref:redoxin domain-containing protein n=1 Tax=Granulicella sp. 5B5 TaxID=1617967 RepID=UPI0015F693C0|nr:redoxin domain-containing protein [Granulicella sp. 5B5]
MRSRILLAACLLGGALSAPAQSYGTRLDGHPLATLAPAGSKAVVLYFIATDCPVSNRTLPEMLRVRNEFRSRGVAFWFVYPNTTETLAGVRNHALSYNTGSNTILDPTGSLVALTHARVTPEAVVLIPRGSAWKTVYAGRIDDRYVRLGLARPQATQHFAEQAVSELLSGKPVQPAVGTPVGCAIINPKAPLMNSESMGRTQMGGSQQ